MKNTNLGILAHVDAGKTTLSEAILYTSGTTRTLGRVDKGNAYLDTFELEKQRGITIFSKQAEFVWKNLAVTLLDTPGHADFSAEMERTLSVLDYGVLVISAANEISGHTKLLWELLKTYEVPVFIFVNKMDQNGTSKEKILSKIKSGLDNACIDFSDTTEEKFYEEIAMVNEDIMEKYIEENRIEDDDISMEIANRRVFPCFFGSALRIEGVEQLLDGIERFSLEKEYPQEFGARIYKISRDENGNRLTHLKITGGEMGVRDVIDSSQEKINQIRIYSGSKYQTVSELKAGYIGVVTGLSTTYVGERLGIEAGNIDTILEPVLMYRLVSLENIDAAVILPKLRIIEEEDPMLKVEWNEELKEIYVRIMGEVQLQVLKSIVKSRFDIDIDFDHGNVVYKETIKNTVTGVGHFEPLKHYAEVHLLLEPGEIGSGLVFETKCNEDILGKNWQRLILTHLEEKEHRGVLTGAAITDMKITIIGGKAHLKHTEGGDFRQATYRAVRQGLKMANSVLLEPYYNFNLEVPTQMLGRAMTDIERMYGKMNPPENINDNCIITGYAPVVTMREYQRDVAAYTKGCGKLSCALRGYLPCHNFEEIIESAAYDSETDILNPTGSIFCAHGAGFYVPYDMVKEYMHLKITDKLNEDENINNYIPHKNSETLTNWLGVDEVDAIINQTYNANKRKDKEKRNSWKRNRSEADYFDYKSVNTIVSDEEKYLLVDGYNVIFAWDELKELAEVNLDSARGKLMDILCNYQAIKQCKLIVVFDAYKVKGHNTEIVDYHNIHVVYTKEAETADQYIEKFAHNNGRKHLVTVATSDGLEQIIIRGQGCMLISSRELKTEIETATKTVMDKFNENTEKVFESIF